MNSFSKNCILLFVLFFYAVSLAQDSLKLKLVLTCPLSCRFDFVKQNYQIGNVVAPMLLDSNDNVIKTLELENYRMRIIRDSLIILDQIFEGNVIQNSYLSSIVKDNDIVLINDLKGKSYNFNEKDYILVIVPHCK